MIGATLGNVIAGGVIGLAVDAASGANFLYRGEMHIGLDPVPGGGLPVMSQLHCPAKGMQAGRTNGTAPIYDDVDPSAPDACAEHDAAGAKRSLCFALAPVNGPDGPAACQALKAVLLGPAGATGSYQATTDSGTWAVNVALAPPDTLVIEDREIRAVRLVEAKSNAASGVEGQVTTWIDPVTGMPLKRTWTQTKGSKIEEPEWEVIKITAT